MVFWWVDDRYTSLEYGGYKGKIENDCFMGSYKGNRSPMSAAFWWYEDEDNGPDYDVDGDNATDCDMNAKTLRYLKARLAKGKFLMGECTKFIRKLL